jgi:hypothetical protein
MVRSERTAPPAGTNAFSLGGNSADPDEGTYAMFVTVIHRIHDPEGFQAAEAKAMEAGVPPHVALPIHAATRDHGLGICIWEGDSIDAVREVVEGAVGPWAQNEYYEMHVDGLVPQLAG